MAQTTRTTVNRSWLIKMSVFFILLLGLGVWGYYDAAVKYPARGRRHADWAKWQYLDIAIDEGFASSASVADPVTEFARLSEPEKLEELRAAQSAAGANARTVLEFARYQWLHSLSLVGDLDPEHTTIDDPRQELRTLEARWRSANGPKPLAGYDILMQWIIAGVGFAGAAFLLLLFFGVSTRRFQFDHETLTLTLPSGVKIEPTDIEVFDKRKWHRFIVFIKIGEGHGKLAGQEIRLDLLRYSPLEDWVKKMFKAAQPDEYKASFPDEFAEPSSAEQESPGDPEQGDEADTSAASA